VTDMYRIAVRNVDMRHKTGPLGLAVKQFTIRAYMWASGVFGLNMASRTGDVMYDIEQGV
jgi:hypothetical protein